MNIPSDISINSIMDYIENTLDEFGFLGDENNAVDVSEWWGIQQRSIIRHALNHAHANGKCVKSKFSFCN